MKNSNSYFIKVILVENNKYFGLGRFVVEGGVARVDEDFFVGVKDKLISLTGDDNLLKEIRARINKYKKTYSGTTYSAYMEKFNGVTLRDLILKYGDKYKNKLRDISRHVMKYYGGDRKCCVCGYVSYVEICHIRALSEFSKEDLVAQMCGINNLKFLCPTHHKELDNGLLEFKCLK